MFTNALDPGARSKCWPQRWFIPVTWLECLAHFCEQLFVVVHNVLASDHRGEVDFNAELNAVKHQWIWKLGDYRTERD